MKLYKVDLKKVMEQRGIANTKENRSRLRKTIVAGLAAAMLVTPFGNPSKANAFDWNLLTHAAGAAVGAALTKKDASDLEKAGAAAGGVVVAEVVKRVFVQPAQQNTNVRRTGVIREQERSIPNPSRVYDYNPATQGRTQCRRTLERVYENGRLVGTKVVERCNSVMQANTYDITDPNLSGGYGSASVQSTNTDNQVLTNQISIDSP